MITDIQTFRWEDYPGFLGGPNIITKVPPRERGSQSQRRWDNESRGQREEI